MQIRLIQENELWNALNLCYQSSIDRVMKASGKMQEPERLQREREQYYQQLLKYETLLEQMKGGQAVIFGAFDNGDLYGAAVLDTGNARILSLAAKQGKREAFIESQLLFEMACFARVRIPRQSFLAEVYPEEAEVYRRLSFTGNTPQFPGEKMYLSRNVEQVLVGGRPKEGHALWWILLAAVVAAVILTMVFWGARSVYHRIYRSQIRISPFEETVPYTPLDPYGENPDIPDGEKDGDIPAPDPYGDEDGEEENEGVMGIETYMGEDVPYTVQEEQYEDESSRTSRYYTYFDIKYLKVAGVSKEVEEKVNQILKDCAMQTKSRYFSSPTEEVKEWMLRQSQPCVMSQVRYKISYMDENLLCVVFEDHYVAGDINHVKLDMRTKIINMKDGTLYEPKDVLDENKEFVSFWKAAAEKEYSDNALLYDFRADEFQDMFEGNYEEKGVRQEIILTGDGVEIGFTYDYADAASQPRNGYMTIDFPKKDLKEFQKDKSFWKMYLPEEN